MARRSERALEIFGLTQETAEIGPYPPPRDCIHPEDRACVTVADEAARNPAG